MRRKTDKSCVDSIFTFFEWNECVNCGFEYRRERVWEYMRGPFYNGNGVLRYCCRICAPTKQEAVAVFNYLGNKPANPPKSE